MAIERTLVLVKPDAMQRGLAGEVIARLERRGLKIAALRLLKVGRPLAQKHYAE
jgi:nucleoside-diphosphate kinase